MKKRVLILGGSGFIGLNLAKHIVSQITSDDELILADNFSRGKNDTEFQDFLNSNLSIKFVSADLTAQEAFDHFEGQFDHVYLLASMVGVKNCELFPEMVMRTNTLIILNTLEWMVKSGSKKIFFSSTSENYAGAYDHNILEIPTPESVPLVISNIENPRFSYAVTKIWGEAAVTFYGKKYGFKTMIGRYHNVYGPRMGYDHVIPQLIEQMLNTTDRLKVMNPDHSRSFCFISDAVRATEMLMNIDKDGMIVHIGDDRTEILIGDLAKEILKIGGKTPEFDVKPSPAGSVTRRLPDTVLLRKITGFVPEVSLPEGLKETFTWYHSRNK